jgi:hypothetical protein
MVPNITTILRRFTGEWAALLQPDAILTVGPEIGYTAWRDRVLTPVTTIQVFLLQILHGVEPRVKKRRPTSFPFMIKPRQALRQQLVQQELGG